MMIGSLLYASTNAHKGLELSRRDDLESLAYMIIQMSTGTLPWDFRITKLTVKKLN